MYDHIPKISFGALKTELKALIWPNGVPENLTGPIDNAFGDAYMELQTYVSCLQDWHADVFPCCSTYFKCGLTAFDAPKGNIRRVRTFQDDFCQPVTLDPVTFQELTCWSRRFMDRVTAPANAGLPTLPGGFRFPDQSTDAQFGRALGGKWSNDRGRIYVAPWIQSRESVVVEWDGLKTKFSDSDLIPDDQRLKRAITLYVKKEFARDWERDQTSKMVFQQDWLDARAELIYVCENERRMPRQESCQSELDSLWAHASEDDNQTSADVPTIVGLIGEFGSDDATESSVAALVKGWKPAGIVSLGNNAYLASGNHGYDLSVGKYFRPFLHPYTGAQPLGQGETDATANKFWPCLGTVDNDHLAEFGTFFVPPGNGRYYDTVIGHCHFFVLNCGRNQAATDTEPTGNTILGMQAGWLRGRLAQSTARWKIVVVNLPPSYFPFLEWNFKAMGADLVVSANHRNYERLSVNSLTYLVAGTGGAALTSSPSPATGSQFQDATHNGGIKLTAGCSSLQAQFIAINGTVVDSVSIT